MWGDKVFVIAEAGVNHNGSSRAAHYLVEAASEARADAVKFQMFDCEKLDPPGERREMLRNFQLTPNAYSELKSHANGLGIEFICTPFDVDSLRFLVDDLKVKTLKIASGNLVNRRLLEAAGRSGCDLILSTGMATLDDVRGAIRTIGRRDTTLLHCTSSYPCSYEDVNLRAMRTLRDAFGPGVGLSDHTEGIAIPIAAAVLGATVIEKHFTLDRNMDGPDHKASIEPNDLAAMIEGIRQIEEAMGNGEKVPRQSEEFAMGISRDRRSWREGTYVEADES